MVAVVSAGPKTGTCHPGDEGQKDVNPGCHKLYCEQVVNTGEPQHVPDASTDPEWRCNEDLVKFGLGVYPGYPIAVNGDRAGPHERGVRLLLVAVLMTVVGAAVVVWASGNHEGRINTDAAGVAIEGCDPVAYFTRGAPVAGSADHGYEWDGVTWHFASAEHRDRFITNPEAYAPAYGGYCAWAVAEGKVAGINPAMWHIENGTLYLNYSAGTNRRFLSDVSGNIARADANWPRVRSRLDAEASE